MSTERGHNAGRPRSSLRAAHSAPSAVSTPAVRLRMQRQRMRDTAPELALRSAVHAKGLRYFVDRAPLPGLRRRADLVFPRARVAVFVDGCFWHRCPEHGNDPTANAAWWKAKLDRNVSRDRNTDELLRNAGWVVLRIWEHEAPAKAAWSVEHVVGLARARNIAGSSRATF